MKVNIQINGAPHILECSPQTTLLDALRTARVWSVKHGCETGDCGACSVLLNGHLTPTCVMLAAQADAQRIDTVEGLTERHELHPIQQAFIDTGAIQCGFCTPAMIMAAKELLDREQAPNAEQVREVLGGVLCRCTGYLRPVQAVLRAAAMLRGEIVPPVDPHGGLPFEAMFGPRAPGETPTPDFGNSTTQVQTQTRVLAPPTVHEGSVGRPEPKVDGVKLAKGRPVFADDIELPGMLHGALLTSPVAHARIKRIDASAARKLPGVHAVLTYADVPRVVYASGGQSHPNPPPYDQVSLDSKVRHVGDRVAVVAAETPAIARAALLLIEVEYEELPAVFDPHAAMQPGAPVIHDEPDAVSITDRDRNLAAEIHARVGDVEAALAAADQRFERTYSTHQVHQGYIEPHIVVTWWDDEDRLVIRTSTQVPFHVRRMVAPLLELPVKRIRVIKPRIGGGFGGKQEMLIEDLCAHLTIATHRPVRFEYTRDQEFTSARSRHAQTLTFRAGISHSGDLQALDLHIVEDTGAYGTHGLTVCSVSGLRGLSTYRCPALRFHGEIVYTNKPTAGAYRGYGGPQAEFALECLMDEIALLTDRDPVAFRMQNAVRVGDTIPITAAIGEGEVLEEGAGDPQRVLTCGLPDCVAQGSAAIAWDRRALANWHQDPHRPHIRRGLGMALCMHGTAIPGLDMGAASIKINDDGSFNVLVGATDLGTGSDTVLAQMAAETLGVPTVDVIIYSSDTDFTPFDTGAYASSTTYISGMAVHKAALQLRDLMFARAALMLKCSTAGMTVRSGRVHTADGRSVSHAEVALHSLHTQDQQQLMATASYVSPYSPPPFGAQFAEVEVDTGTGQVTVVKLVMAVDCGVAINPLTALGQIEGGMVQALGYAVCEEMPYDEHGRLQVGRLGDYRIFSADEMPEMEAILVPTYEPTGPFGAKAVAEIPLDGVAPAVANAVYDAIGVRIRSLPLTPERVWRAQAQAAGAGALPA